MSNITPYQEHRHPEAEFIYCLSHSFEIAINKKHYTVNKGEMVLIAPMAIHEIIKQPGAVARGLVIEVGPVLLGTHFESLAKGVYKTPTLILDDGQQNHSKLRKLLMETVEIFQNRDDYSELELTGNVYKICTHLLREISADGEAIRDLRAVVDVEKAIELIHNHYNEPLTVERAAAVTGYSKSNFCKIFKNVVGDTFHSVLSNHRVENACCFLEETALPVAEIAHQVGFSDVKSFCRVFKNYKGVSPGQYRKEKRQQK